jgi:hypothetical protein
MEENFTPEQSAIRSEIDSILQSDSYRNAFSPDHPATQEKIQALYSRLYPSEEQASPPEQPTETLGNPPNEAPTDPLDNPLTPEEGEAIASLKTEWGADWEANVTAAQGVVESLSKDLGYDVADFLEDSRLGSDATTIKAMYDWSRGEPGPEIGAAEAQAILDKVRKSALYQKGDSRARDTLLDVVQALYRVVHPEV